MATLLTRWLLSTLLVNVTKGFAREGPPAPPSPPNCYIPCDEYNCEADIHCSWDYMPDPQIPTNYSLHWELVNSEEEHVIKGTSSNAIIQRHSFSQGAVVGVWVQAKNQYGSAESQKKEFNSEEISKPPPPKVVEIQHGAEIQWVFNCAPLHLPLKTCGLRHRTQVDQVWVEVPALGLHPAYTFDSLQPCMVYEFQVRCACELGLMSDWSAIYSLNSTKTGPVGEVDVWIGCGISSASFDCILTWKKLSTSQDCGLFLMYEVVLSYHNGTAVMANMSTAERDGQLVCDEKQCQLNSFLKDVSSVSVSAYNVHGATVPSYLTMPMPVKGKNDQAIHLKMNEENLTVSWDPLSGDMKRNIKEYVVQYKQAGCLSDQGFDWIKVNKSQTKGTFTGHFQNYKPYEVSLFTVSHSGEVHHLASSIGYSLEGTPSRVSSFNVFSIAATRVTLLWEPVPLCKQNGVILKYQIGVDREKVYTVDALQHENQTFEVLHLSPGWEYEVWIKAVTKAGPGENATRWFKTKHHEAYLIPPVLGILGILLLCLICAGFCVVRAYQGESKACLLLPSCFYEKVPDPRNSHIFRQMKHQINDPFAWICIPVNEPHPKICLLEVVESQPWALKSCLEKTSDPDGLVRQKVGDQSSQLDCQDDQEEDAVTEENQKTENRRKAYSKMVDSDEEEAREDCWSPSEEEPCGSGYEKHFMPTASEILV